MDRARDGYGPALNLELRPRGRGASVRKAQNRYKDALRERKERLPKEQARNEEKVNEALHEALVRAALETMSTEVDLKSAFTKAAEDDRGDEGDGGDGGGGVKISRARRRSERGQERRGRKGDFERER